MPQAKFRPLLEGIGKAMTFRGFCNLHDTELFRPIEVDPIEPSIEQAVLLGYRAVSFELFQKMCHKRAVPFFRETDRGKPPWVQERIQEMVSLHEAYVDLGLLDLCARKEQYEQPIVNRDFSTAHYLAFHFDRVPDVVCSGSCVPEFDFAGNQIQSILSVGDDRTLQALSFCSIPTEHGGLAMLIWVGDQPAITQFARSLALLSDDDIPDALVRLMFEFFENLAAAPDWWETLSDDARDALLRRLSEGNLGEPRPYGLLDDGLRTARGRVTKRSTHGFDLGLDLPPLTPSGARES
jgi:hypothetical protein